MTPNRFAEGILCLVFLLELSCRMTCPGVLCQVYEFPQQLGRIKAVPEVVRNPKP